MWYELQYFFSALPFTVYKLQFKLQGLFQSSSAKTKLPARHIAVGGGREKKSTQQPIQFLWQAWKSRGLRTGIRFFQLKFPRQISGAESPPSYICDGRVESGRHDAYLTL